jgi:hypothetical protein
MTTDQGANRTSGETEGIEQEPTEPGEHDSTQREQAAKEGRPPINNPAQPDAEASTTDPLDS